VVGYSWVYLGQFILTGLSESWIAIGLIIGAWLNWYLVAGRLRVHTEVQNNALTLPDYFTSRFDDQKRSYVFSLPLLFWFSSRFTVLLAW
jgi:Na+/proline symporter